MSSLLQAQEGPPSSDDIASALIGQADTDGDGQLSASEIQAALGDGGGDQFKTLDGDSDGLLSQAELSAGLQQMFESRSNGA